MTKGRWFDPEHVAIWDANPHRLNPVRSEQLEILTAIAAAAWQPGDRIVDLACGTGHVLEQLASALPEADLTGVDYSPVVLAQAQARIAKATFVEHDLNAPIVPTLTAGSFAIAVSVQSFHHFNDDQRARQLADIHELLRPGGLLLIQDRFAVAAETLLPEYQALWRHLGELHGLELPDEPLPSATPDGGERAADLNWFLERLREFDFTAAPFAMHGTRTLIVGRRR